MSKTTRSKSTQALPRNSKRGFSTIVTIFSVLLLLLTFIIFIVIFKRSSESSADPVENKFSSLEAEFVLKTFLRSTAMETRKFPLQDLTPDVGEPPTNADLVSWTCQDEEGKNYKLLQESINTYFDSVYQNDWQLKITYSNPDLDSRSFGHKSWLRDILKTISGGIGSTLGTQPGQTGTSIYFLAHSYKEKGLGTQVIPCQDGSFCIVMLKARDFINYKDIVIAKEE